MESRTLQHVLPAIARIYSRLRQLRRRLHSDRARDFMAMPLRRWAQHRDTVLTKTSGDNYKANGRCEAELGLVKPSIRTVLSAGGYSLNWRPLISKHVGERRLRAQLRSFGFTQLVTCCALAQRPTLCANCGITAMSSGETSENWCWCLDLMPVAP